MKKIQKDIKSFFKKSNNSHHTDSTKSSLSSSPSTSTVYKSTSQIHKSPSSTASTSSASVEKLSGQDEDLTIPSFFTSSIIADAATSRQPTSNPSMNSRMLILDKIPSPPSRPSQPSASNAVLDLGTIEKGPSQPNVVFPKTQFGNRFRSFSANYYRKYNWLEYSVSEDKVFCFFCRQFLTGVIRQQNEKFVSTGFCKWKKLSEYLQKHEESELHIQCTEKYISYKQTLKSGSVIEKVFLQNDEEIAQNRDYFIKLIDLILYLVRQGLPLRGHREDSDAVNRGNFLEICGVFSKYDSNFSSHFNKNISYCSPKIQNEIINIIAKLTLEEIIREVRKCGFFSIMVDEARCFKEEQLSINIRYVQNLEVEERFLCFINCSDSRDAQSLADIMFEFLRNSNLSDIPIIAQSYDGASVMSGKHQGVQAKIKEFHPQAVYIHCLAHRMNLVVVDSCSNVPLATSFFNILEALYVHFSKPGNHSRLVKVSDSLGISSGFEIRSLSTTRWSCRYENCNAVLKNYQLINEVLDEEISESKDKNCVEALGLLSSIKKPEFLVNLFIFTNVLSITNILSKYFQSKNATLGQASKLIIGTIASLEEKRNSFHDLWKEIEEFAETHDVSLEPPRASKKRRQPPEKLKEYVIESTLGRRLDELPSVSSNSEYWKIFIYNQVMDNLITHFKRRFDNLPLAESVDAFLKLDLDGGSAFIENYKDVFDINKAVLKAEVLVTKNFFKAKALQINLENLKKDVKEEFTPTLYKLLQIAIGLPISSANCERSFSAMRRVKTWLRATMTQERFSHLALLTIENQIVKEKITANHVLDLFTSKDRKIKII